MTSKQTLGRVVVDLTILLSGLVVVLIAWWAAQDPTANLGNSDWLAFDRAAENVRAGQSPYPFDRTAEPYPFLYPPFAVWLVLPLAWLGFVASWAYTAFSTFAAFSVATVYFSRSSAGQDRDLRPLLLVIGSGSVITSTLIGQFSGWLALSVAGGAYLYATNRRFRAGVVLAFLCTKPNLAIVVPVLLVWSRSWHSLKGFAVGFTGLFVVSVPFGLEYWSDWIHNLEVMADMQAENTVPFDKMITVQGALQEAFGLASDSPVLIGLWLCIALVTGLAVLYTWRREVLAADPLLSFSAMLLFMVAANLRVYFYDGTLVALGLFGLWLVYRPHMAELGAAHRTSLVGVLILGWFAGWGGAFQTLNLLTGALAAGGVFLLAHRARAVTQPARNDTSSFTPEIAEESGVSHEQVPNAA